MPAFTRPLTACLLPEPVRSALDHVRANPAQGLPEGMLQAPRPRRPFHRKPDPLLRAAGLWNTVELAAVVQQLWHDRLGQPEPIDWLTQRVQDALEKVLEQVPQRVVTWNDKIGERLETCPHPFTPEALRARDQCLETLLAFGLPVNGRVLGQAAALKYDAPRWFDRLLDHPVQDFDMNGGPLLNWLAGDDQVWAVRRLVAAGARVNDGRDRASAGDPDVLGETALGCAARMGQAAACDVLLELGADPRLVNERGATPAQVARERGHDRLAQRLLEQEQQAWRQEMAPTGDVAPVLRPRPRL